MTDGELWFAGLCQHPLCPVTLDSSWQAQLPPWGASSDPTLPGFWRPLRGWVPSSLPAWPLHPLRQPQKEETKANTFVWGLSQYEWVGPRVRGEH